MRYLGAALLASTTAASCGLFGYERIPEQGLDSLPGVLATNSDPGDVGDPASTKVPQDAGADPGLLAWTDMRWDAGTDPEGNGGATGGGAGGEAGSSAGGQAGSSAGGEAGSGEDAGAPDADVPPAGCDPSTYIADVSCGVGYCRTTNQPSTCVGGVETACVPGAPLGASDATCDGVDDNCSGSADEDYPATPTSCGVGACASTGLLSCQAGVEVDSCVPGTPLATDTAASGVGVDDDCDGTADEDEPCDTTPRLYTPGNYAAIAVPLNCTQVTVQLWGGAGAGGEREGVLNQPGGRGGAGGYAQSTLTLVSGQQLDLLVGTGGSAACNAPGGGTAGFAGGSGGTGTGADGDDGLQSGGGSGATPSSASRGGNGYRGGGGGGAGSGVIGLGGKAGGGGAASAFFVAGTPVVLAGGGGGGGGAAGIILNVLGVAGGAGGTGCGGAGAVANQNGGGGGGGGACLGQVVQAGVNGVPFSAASLPANQASGGQSSCLAGGGGYAIVTFGP